MDTKQTAIAADCFPFSGVCPFCRTVQRVHSESGLCRGCLADARRRSAVVAIKCACPAGEFRLPGHLARVQARAARVLHILRAAGGELPLTEIRADIGLRGGEEIVSLLRAGLIEHIGARGTMSAGYRLAA